MKKILLVAACLGLLLTLTAGGAFAAEEGKADVKATKGQPAVKKEVVPSDGQPAVPTKKKPKKNKKPKNVEAKG